MNEPGASNRTTRATQQILEKLLVLLESIEQDRFASHLFRSRQEYRLVCQCAGKGGKSIKRCHLVRVGD